MIESTMFPVREIPVPYPNYTIKGDNVCTWDNNKETGHKLIIREDTNEVISCVTKKYNLVTNQEIINKATPILKKYEAKLQECKTFANGARTQWTWRLPSNKLTVTTGDVINPQIIIKNSYDASTQVGILGGIFRLVCSNGMVVGDIYGKHNSRHTIWNSSLNNGWIPNRVEKTCKSISEHLTSDLSLLRDTKINNKDIPKVIKQLPEKGVTEIVNYLANDKPETYWELLNAATFVFTHHLNRDNETTHINEARVYSQILNMAKTVTMA
jgi:hypothetical protein